MLNVRKHILLLGGVAALLSTACLALTGAEELPNLVNSSSLSLQKQTEISTIPPSWNGNIDCYQETADNCVLNTYYGSANTGSSLRLSGTDNYQPVISYIDGRKHYLPIPNSSSGLVYTTEPPYGVYLYFYYNFESSIAPADNAGNAYYQVNRAPDAELTDSSSNRLAADYTSISFSENGKWMIVSQPNVAMLRVNLDTFQVLPFAPGFNYTIGLDPQLQTAITNDGRYAVVASKIFGRFEIYNLAACTNVPTTMTSLVSCQSHTVQNYMQDQIPNFTGANNIRFIGDDTISFYASYLVGSTTKFAKYILSTQSGNLNRHDYLALGDSYISGEGAFDYLPATDTTDNQCHVSRFSYPLLLGLDLNFNSFHSVACSGATTNDILNTSDQYSGQAKNGLQRKALETSDSLSGILTNFKQGYIYQNNFVSQYQPKVITLSIGGNDIGFSNRLQDCLKPGTCYSTFEDRLEFVREVNRTFPKLVSTYSRVKNLATPNTRIYVIGYPQIAKADGDCAVNVQMNKDELTFASQAINYLDAVIESAARKAGVFYVDAQDALRGHRMCEASGKSLAMNGATAGNDFPDRLGGPIGRESYHPNDFGHQLLENKILLLSNNLTAPMPPPNLDSSPPSETGLDILNAPHIGREVRSTSFTPELAPNVLFKSQQFKLVLAGAEHGILPKSLVKAEIQSDPVSLGSFTTDSLGNLSANPVLPDSIPVGFHTLHVYGTNLDGGQIDLFKTIYVAFSQDDFNGDGAPDSPGMCIGVTPSGQDYDQDGIDDGCDGVITDPAPALISSSATESNPQVTNITFVARYPYRPSNNTPKASGVVLAASKNLDTLKTKPINDATSTTASRSLPRYGLVFLALTSVTAIYFAKRF
jgi:hypothetical protein